MEGIRLRRAVIGVGAAAAATLAPLAFLASGASATAGGTGTTTTVTGPASVATGQAATFTATVALTGTGPAAKPTGTVTFAITGSDASTVSCTDGTDNAVTLTRKDKAQCKVPAGTLQHSSSTYSVVATYSGDTNYAGSSGSLAAPLVVSAAKATVHLVVSPKPTSTSGTTATATVTAGKAGSQLGGTVLFLVTDNPSAKAKLLKCSGGDSQPLAVSNGVGTAVCNLSAGWFPGPSSSVPRATWSIEAGYSGTENIAGNETTKNGSSKQ